MNKTIEYASINDNSIGDSYILVDVRSPGEFEKATIPGAINIPLFNNEEREEIGTIYVNESVDKAKSLGVQAASLKLSDIYEKVQCLDKEYKKVIFFCERGGMRSSCLVSFLLTLGINAYKIRGGYKGYRGFINENLPKVINDIKFIVIHGNTGVGKTKLLKVLLEEGRDILDLEGCANNRGSLFGDIGLGKENSQKMFESLVFHSLAKRKSETVFVEAESKRIGHIILPEFLYKSMINGEHINITASIDARISNIMDDYVKNNNNELIDHIMKLDKYISSKNIEIYKEEINRGNYGKVIEELMIKYYDPMYENKSYDYSLEVDSSDLTKCTENIINYFRWNIGIKKVVSIN